MYQNDINIILVILTVIILVALPLVNHFYKKRADEFADNLLLEIPEEYNKQIKGNAYRYLIGRNIIGLFILSSFVWNFKAIFALGFSWQVFVALFLGITSIVWGIYGYKSEMKKIKELN